MRKRWELVIGVEWMNPVVVSRYWTRLGARISRASLCRAARVPKTAVRICRTSSPNPKEPKPNTH